MTNQTFSLDLIPRGIAPIVHVSQYDKGQTWTITLMENGLAYTIPAGVAVIILGTKPDGYGFEYPCTYDGSVVTSTVHQQMTAVEGDVQCEIRLQDDDDIIGTVNFIIRVEPAALSDDTIISDSDIAAIEEAIELITTIPEIENELNAIKEDAEAWAVGTKDGTPVSSTDPQYQNNAKYYAENCVGMITDAQWSSIQAILN